MLGAAAPQNQPLDGVDIMPLLKAKGVFAGHDRSLFWHFPAYLQGKDYPGAPDNLFRARPFSVVRSGNWKLIETFEDNRLQLFDLSRDIGETTDLSATHPRQVERLKQRFLRWRQEMDSAEPRGPFRDY